MSMKCDAVYSTGSVVTLLWRLATTSVKLYLAESYKTVYFISPHRKTEISNG